MALSNSQLMGMLDMALSQNRILPIGDRNITLAQNKEDLVIGEEKVKICETIINITRNNRIVHVGFNAWLLQAAITYFSVAVDGVEQPHKFQTTTRTMSFTDMLSLNTGLHYIEVYAYSESTVKLPAREAKLGVYL